MLNPIKLTAPDDKIFLTSDGHVGHDRPWIVQARGFQSVTEHDEAFIQRWNAAVPDDGIVFHLGDLTFADPEGKRFMQLVRRLRYGTIYSLHGNHLSGTKQVYSKLLWDQFGLTDQEVYPLTLYPDAEMRRSVVFLPQYVEVKVRSDLLILCHYALESWNSMSRGSLMLCGHSHGSLKRSMPNRLDVGIDVYGAPISLTRIKEITKGHIPEVVDHHGAGE